jgi:sphinganine-1-phosphate aldolase
MSCDTHKYGFGPKGLSVCMFRSNELRRGIIFGVADWHGGFYATPSLAGSRPGATIAGTWAAMMSIGKDGYNSPFLILFSYVEKVKTILTAAQKMRESLKKIDGMEVLSIHEVRDNK